MKTRNYFCLILIFILLLMSNAYATPKADFNLNSESAILVDSSSGQVLYSKNPQKVQSPGGLTKIMAALIVIDSGKLEDLAKIKQSYLDSVANTSTIGLVEGENLTMREMIYGMLLQSANDCAVTAAMNVCDSQDTFIKKMNDKAKEIGATHTHFSNVTGLYDKENYTTAEDMATIVGYAISNPTYLEIAGAKSYILPMNNKVAYERTLKSKCALISESSYIYKGVNSGISGYTQEGNYTAAVSASKNGFGVISIVMNCAGEYSRYADIKNLFDYAFSNYRTLTISPEELQIPKAALKGVFGKTGEVTFSLDEAVTLTVPAKADIKNLKFDYNINKKYKKADEYTATVGISYENEKITDLNLKGTAVKKITFYNVLKTIFLIILILILVLVGLFIFYIADSERKRKKRKQEKIKRSLGVKKDI